MKWPLWVNPQYLDANSIGGFNAAFGLVSGSVVTLGNATYPVAGLLSPESMTLGFAGMTASVGLPPPWGLVTSGGVIVHAHGTQSGQDTTNYSVGFGGLVPASGSLTAYLAASVTQIQQNAFPLTGPPQGHPSFNPNFIPTTAYATNTWSVALTATSGRPDNVTSFELFRTTLNSGQASLTTVSDLGWLRAPNYQAAPSTVFASGGVLTQTQAQAVISPGAAGLSQTLPVVATAGGLSYRLVNPLVAGNWTIAAQGTDRLTGATATAAASLTLPPGGAVQVWGNAASGQWNLTAVNPLMFASLANVFSVQQTITTSGAAGLVVSGTAAGFGGGLELIGNGATPNKYIRSVNGNFDVVNSAYTAAILTLTDAGALSVVGGLSAASLGTVGAATIGSTLTVIGNAQVNGSLTTQGGVSAGAAGILTTGGLTSATISTTGNIVSGARLRAVTGARGSNDQNAAVILGDFGESFWAVNTGYTINPSGVIDQTTTATVPVTAGVLVTTVVTLSVAYPNATLDSILSYLGNTPPAGVSISVQPLNLSQVTVTTNPGTAGNGVVGVVIRSRGI